MTMRIRTVSLILVLLVGNGAQLQAYDAETHSEIARRAVQPEVSSLDQYLKAELGMREGIKEKLLGGMAQEQTVERLIADGARSEDNPVFRVLNHFHNPLLPWDQAGLAFGLQLGQSSVFWQQNATQHASLVLVPPLFLPFPALGGTWSWPMARMRFLDFLTQPNPADRERAF